MSGITKAGIRHLPYGAFTVSSIVVPGGDAELGFHTWTERQAGIYVITEAEMARTCSTQEVRKKYNIMFGKPLNLMEFSRLGDQSTHNVIKHLPDWIQGDTIIKFCCYTIAEYNLLNHLPLISNPQNVSLRREAS
jgi:hypothetical protein